jgi:DNA-damage-inducible protein J
MSIQISTRIDEVTKQQFDKVCESIGISTSNALSMFIKSVINYNGIPFQAIAPKEKTNEIKGILANALEAENNLSNDDWEEMTDLRSQTNEGLSRMIEV